MQVCTLLLLVQCLVVATAESWKGTQEKETVFAERDWGNDSWGKTSASPAPAAPATVSHAAEAAPARVYCAAVASIAAFVPVGENDTAAV